MRATNCRRVITLMAARANQKIAVSEPSSERQYDMSDIVFITNDSPKSEDPYKILDDICIGFRDEVR